MNHNHFLGVFADMNPSKKNHNHFLGVFADMNPSKKNHNRFLGVFAGMEVPLLSTNRVSPCLNVANFSGAKFLASRASLSRTGGSK